MRNLLHPKIALAERMDHVERAVARACGPDHMNKIYAEHEAEGRLDKMFFAIYELGRLDPRSSNDGPVPIRFTTPASSGPAASAPPAPPPAPPKPLSLAQQLAQISPLDGLARAKFMQANEAGLKRELREQEAEQLRIQSKNNR